MSLANERAQVIELMQEKRLIMLYHSETEAANALKNAYANLQRAGLSMGKTACDVEDWLKTSNHTLGLREFAIKHDVPTQKMMHWKKMVEQARKLGVKDNELSAIGSSLLRTAMKAPASVRQDILKIAREDKPLSERLEDATEVLENAAAVPAWRWWTVRLTKTQLNCLKRALREATGENDAERLMSLIAN